MDGVQHAGTIWIYTSQRNPQKRSRFAAEARRPLWDRRPGGPSRGPAVASRFWGEMQKSGLREPWGSDVCMPALGCALHGLSALGAGVCMP